MTITIEHIITTLRQHIDEVRCYLEADQQITLPDLLSALATASKFVQLPF